MQARMKNPAMLLPDALTALQAVSAAVNKLDIPKRTIGLCHIRASQINGCGACLDMHVKHAKKDLDETEQRMMVVAAWRDAPFYTEAERAALALTESVTRLSERNGEGVPDEVWDAAAKHFDERQLAGLVVQISLINLWNRLNVTTRQVPGAAW